MADFVVGFEMAAHFLLRLVGVVSAVLVLALLVFFVTLLASLAFDWITNAIGRRWANRAHKPKNKLERIILEPFQRSGDSHGGV